VANENGQGIRRTKKLFSGQRTFGFAAQEQTVALGPFEEILEVSEWTGKKRLNHCVCLL
jgi:hypothetical protein